MSKKKKNRSRDTPQKVVTLTTMDVWQTILDGDYVPLYDCPEVRMCVNAYADMISNMTIHLMRNTPDGDVRVRDALARKIDVEPCEHMTRKSWLWNIVNILLTTGGGNCVVYPEYSRDGYIENLRPLPPSQVSFIEGGDEGYVIQYGGRELNPSEVLHFVLNPDPERPWMGTGMRVSLRDVVKSIRQTNTTKNALMESPVPSLIVSVDGLSDDMDTAEGRDKIAEKYLSQSRSGKPWIIASELMKIEQVKPLTLSDLAIKDNVELDRRTVAGVLGVPPYLVGIGTYNREELRYFVANKLLGIAQCIQQTLTGGLLYSPDMYFRLNARSLYNYDLTELGAIGKDMVDRMALRRNEWRDWVGLSPDEEMNELLALENYIPADRLGDQGKLTGGGGNE